jgi:hypothetical protein
MDPKLTKAKDKENNAYHFRQSLKHCLPFVEFRTLINEMMAATCQYFDFMTYDVLVKNNAFGSCNRQQIDSIDRNDLPQNRNRRAIDQPLRRSWQNRRIRRDEGQ